MKLYITLALLLLASFAFAAPVLIDPAPANNSYTGKGSVTFYVNTTAGSDVRLFVISEDAYNNAEPWDNYTMTCDVNWRCGKTVSFSIAGSDTLEYFYFEGNDSGGTTQFTSPLAPLKFKIDRTAPIILFNAPANNSYISGSQALSVNVSDTVSGVNLSRLQYSTGSGWIQFNGSATFDTTQFSNGQIVVVSVNATDNMGNSGVAHVNTTVDNSGPAISFIYPNGNVVKGAVSFNMTASDALSGIDATKSFVTIGATNINMTCAAGLCNCTINTTQYSDGATSAVFHAYDNANNAASSTANFSVLNTPPPIALAPKGYANGYPVITANLTNPGSIVTGVVINITKGGNATSADMACNPGFTSCSYQLPSWGEGVYQLAAVAQNTVGHAIGDSGTLTIDTTTPALVVSVPDVIKTSHAINAEVTDANNDRNSVTLTILGNTQNFACVPQSTTLYCSLVYNFGSINDGRYNATVNATDFAGNSAVYTKEVVVDRNPPSLIKLVIEPLNPEISKGVMITAVLSDDGSDVSSAFIVLKSAFSQQTIQLTRSTQYNWSASFVSSSGGSYNADVNATDENGNSAIFEKVGYFFMGGLLNCGNSVCNSEENYCICPEDCSAPYCGVGVVSCTSGLPVCTGPLRCGDGVCINPENCNTCPTDCGVCLGTAPTKSKLNTTSPGNEVSETAGNVFNFATGNTPIFVTATAIIVLAVIVAFVWSKRRHKYY